MQIVTHQLTKIRLKLTEININNPFISIYKWNDPNFLRNGQYHFGMKGPRFEYGYVFSNRRSMHTFKSKSV